MSLPLLRAAGIEKHYGYRRVLRGLNLDLYAGECYALLGINGSGKSTFIRIAAGLAGADAGRFWFAGKEMPNLSTVRHRIALVSHHTFCYGEFTALENLVFYGKLYGVSNPADKASGLLREVGLGAWLHEPIAGFSRGMQQRLALARGLMSDPELLLLDEPFTGLDQQGVAFLEGRIRGLTAEGRAVLLVTHSLDQVHHAAQRYGVLAGGRIVEQGEMAGLSLAGLHEQVAGYLVGA